MNNFEIQNILDTFEVLVDTREQSTPKSIERYESFGVSWRRQTLNYGDYTYSVKLDGKDIHDQGERVNGICCIERKQNLDELAMCFTRERKRFEREFERASEHNARMILLVENASWDMIFDGQYRSKFSRKAFIASLVAWQVRYGMTVVFCESRNSGMLIKEILYRDIKERLERGEFDGLDKTS